MTEQPPKEFRLKSGSAILNYIRQFSATEKAIFGVLVIAAIVTALAMAFKANSLFMVEVPSYGGQLREGLVGLPRTVNPVIAVTDVDRDISVLVYSGLTRYANGQLVPDLAKDWNISADGLTYTFNLRPDARFQDGTPLTADDVVFTIQKIQDSALKSPLQADWANVTVAEISPSQVQFVLKQAYSPFLSNTTVGIIPKHIWSKVSDDQFIFSQYNINPVGSGPYKTDAIDRDSHGIPVSYSVTTWNGYYGRMPYLSTIAFDFFSDEDSALSALDGGQIDSLPSVPADQASRLASDTAEGYTVLKSPLPRVFGVFFNQNQNPALADKNVRTALEMSVDRQAIVKDSLSGFGSPIDGPLPIGIGDPTTGIAGPDIAGAQALLEKNGWAKDANGIYEKKSKKTSIVLAFDIYTADTADLKQAAEMVKQSWSDLGASVNVKIFEPSDLYQNVIQTRKYDALLFGEFIGKDRDLYAFWDSSQRNAPGLNVAMYTNPQADKLLDSLRTAGDAARAPMFSQFEGIVRADVPAVFLYVPDFAYVVPKSLHGVDLSDMAVPSDRFSSVSSWYMSTERVWKIFAH